MQFEKKHLSDLRYCYAVGLLEHNNRKKILVASEAVDACYVFDAQDFTQGTVWDGPGGTMSIIALEGTNGEFLAIQNFFPSFQGEKAIIVWGKPNGDRWDIKTLLHLPYVHRFDVIEKNGVKYFFAATICSSKISLDDWSDPGKIYVGVLPDDLNNKKINVHPILDGLTRNHGYLKGMWKGKEVAFVSADQGMFALTPPDSADNEWAIEKIMDKPISDMAFCDIDNDGEVEIATIEAFHGNKILINKFINGEWKSVYEYDKEIAFAHVIWGGKLRGQPTFIAGCRMKDQELVMIQKNGDEYITTMIDSNVGPSNIVVINGDHHDLIISANREIGEAAIYIITD